MFTKRVYCLLLVLFTIYCFKVSISAKANSSPTRLYIEKEETNLFVDRGREDRFEFFYYRIKNSGKYKKLQYIDVSADNPAYMSKNGILYTKDQEILLYCPPCYNGEVYIDKNVKKISYYAFEDCKNITGFNVDSDNEYYKSEEGVLFNSKKTVLYCYPSARRGVYIISSDIEAISPNAFSPSLISELVYANREKDILVSSFTFCGCSNLRKVVYENGSDKKVKRMYEELDNDSPYPMKVKFYNVKKYQRPTSEVTTFPIITVSNENISDKSFWSNWWIYAIGVMILLAISLVIYHSKR